MRAHPVSRTPLPGNDTSNISLDDGTSGNLYGCANQVPIGVVPNQYGTWIHGRGGWCPGQEVIPWTANITDDLVMGGENTLAYRGLLDGAERTVESTDGRIEVSSYLVLFE